MGELPQQLDANLRILERLQEQYKTTSESIRAAEDRSIILQNQIEQFKKRDRYPLAREFRGTSGSNQQVMEDEGIPEDALILEFNRLKRDLSIARSKYTESHPDVIDLKRKIVNLEPKVKELMAQLESAREARLKQRDEKGTEPHLPVPVLDPVTERLLAQYTEQYNSALLEAKRSKEEEMRLKEQIDRYQRRIEDTPKREQELTLLTRDYDLLKTNYQSLLDKKIQAQMAENLERKQQGEQFKILDPARLPEKPIKPDRNKIFLIGAMLGLMAGLGLAWFRESLDRSLHSVSEVEVYLALPVIATIPNLEEERKLSSKRRFPTPRLGRSRK